MPHQWTRINLSATQFPFESDFQGRTVLLPQYDTNFDFIGQRGQPDMDRGLPQAFYMHNCMPTAQGYQAIGYEQLLSGINGANDFDNTFQLEYATPQVAKFLFAPANGKNYVFDANVGIWESMAVLGNAGTSPVAPAQTLNFGAAQTYVDESFQLVNDTVLSSLGAFCNTGTANTITLFVMLQNSPGSYTVAASVSGVHNGSGWQDFALAYTVPSTGNYFLALYLPLNTTFNYNVNVVDAVYVGLAAGTQTFTENTTALSTVSTPAMRATTAARLAIPQSAIVTSAYINGKTYIYYQNIGCMYYDQTAKVMQMVALNGLVLTKLKGICAANGYMIAYDDTTIAWSNAANPEDMFPSLITGAGGGPVQFTNGKIQFCLSISGGFLLYCERNVVGATYTANVRYPYVFGEVAGSGGCQSPTEVTWQGNLSSHTAWTTAGIQQLTKSTSELMYVQATDFLSGLSFEDFDEVSLTLSLTYLQNPVATKLSIVAERWVVISYGVNFPDFTHALVFDLALKRWGKLKIKHRSCFEWNAPNIYGAVAYGGLVNTSYGTLSNTTYGALASAGVAVTEITKKNLCFMQADGTIQAVNFDIVETFADGVLILGKFQFQRNKFIVHQRTDVETVLNGNNFAAYLINSLNGKDLLAAEEMNILLEGQMMRRFGKRRTGQNFSLLFTGSFNLTSVLLDVMMAGGR